MGEKSYKCDVCNKEFYESRTFLYLRETQQNTV